MSKQFIMMILALSAFALPLSADGAPEQKCSVEVLHSYFPEEFVAISLEKFDVAEDQRQAIQSELAEKDKMILKLVEEKASKMDPNPLKNKESRKETVQLFRETLFEQFNEVLSAHGVTDKEKVQQMLDDVQLQKAKRVVECRKKPLS